MDEKRSFFRQKTFKGGTISYGIVGGIECVIRNLSKTGACLELADPVLVPENFTLVIKPQLVKRQCTVAWRSVGRIGVRFAS
jgi:PilZ domain